MREVPDLDAIQETWYMLTALPPDARRDFLDKAMWRISHSDFSYLHKLSHYDTLQPLIEYNRETDTFLLYGIVIDICRNVDCRFPQLVLTVDKRIAVP